MDVKARAAMFNAKKPEPPPKRQPPTGKVAIAGVFSGG